MAGLGRTVPELDGRAHNRCGRIFIVAGVHDQADVGLDDATLRPGKSDLASRDHIPNPSIDNGSQ